METAAVEATIQGLLCVKKMQHGQAAQLGQAAKEAQTVPHANGANMPSLGIWTCVCYSQCDPPSLLGGLVRCPRQLSVSHADSWWFCPPNSSLPLLTSSSWHTASTGSSPCQTVPQLKTSARRLEHVVTALHPRQQQGKAG